MSADKVRAKVQETATEEYDRVKNLAADAVQSRSFLYPLHGIWYFASHRSLWQPLLSKLAPTMTLGLGITSAMFLLTYVPQAAVLAFTDGPLAPFTAVPLVLSESSTLLDFLSRSFLIGDALVDTFDGTLVSKDMTDVVSEGRQLKPGSDAIARLGKLIKSPLAKYSPKALIRYFMYLPLNFIPVVGTVLFILAQGRGYGPGIHERYFQLKKFSSKQKEEWIEQHKGAYTSFGVVAILLQMIPFAGILFNFTNTVGAALWAADLERQITTAPSLKDQAKKAM